VREQNRRGDRRTATPLTCSPSSIPSPSMFRSCGVLKDRAALRVFDPAARCSDVTNAAWRRSRSAIVEVIAECTGSRWRAQRASGAVRARHQAACPSPAGALSGPVAGWQRGQHARASVLVRPGWRRTRLLRDERVDSARGQPEDARHEDTWRAQRPVTSGRYRIPAARAIPVEVSNGGGAASERTRSA